MLADGDRINDLPVRAEIRVPKVDGSAHWLTSVVICQDVRKGTFVVWSMFDLNGRVYAENGVYDIRSYQRAVSVATARVVGRLPE